MSRMTDFNLGLTQSRRATLEDVLQTMGRSPRAILPITGDCLEAAGAEDGGWVAVDFSRFPRPPLDGREDLCLCCARWPGEKEPAVMGKVYCGVWGPWQMVGTRYDLTKGHRQMNCAMRAERIFGVIYAAWKKDGTLAWEQELEQFPERLGDRPTIRGGNCGEPLPLSSVAQIMKGAFSND